MKNFLSILLVSFVLAPGPWAMLRAQAPAELSLSLREAAERTLNNNPLVQAAHQDVAASEKQASRAWREYLPTISANARYSYLNDDLALKVNPITLPLPPRGYTVTVPPIHLLDRSTVRADISATMPIFTGLRIESGIRAARHLVQEATAQDTLALQKSVAEAIVSYHQCLLASQVLEARREARATVGRHQHDVQLLCAQGVATQYDLVRANLAVADADRALQEAENQETLALRMLKKVLALPEDTGISLTDSLRYMERNVTLNSLLLEARANRPELASLQEKREAVKAMSSAEFGKMLPQIGAFARYELVDKSLTQLDPKWVVGVGASLTIFNGLKDLAAAQAYDIQEKKIDEVEREVVNAIDLEVRKYFSEMQTAGKNIATAQTAVELATEALRMANRRFETGAGTSLEVIDAQTSVVANKTAYAAALFAYRASYVQLIRSVGRTEELLTGVF